MSLSTVLSDPFDGRIDLVCDIDRYRRELARIPAPEESARLVVTLKRELAKAAKQGEAQARAAAAKLRGALPMASPEPRPATPTSSTLTTALALVGWAHA